MCWLHFRSCIHIRWSIAPRFQKKWTSNKTHNALDVVSTSARDVSLRTHFLGVTLTQNPNRCFKKKLMSNSATLYLKAFSINLSFLRKSLFSTSELLISVGSFSELDDVQRFQFVVFFILFLPFRYDHLHSIYIEYYYSLYTLILPISIYYQLRNHRHKTLRHLTQPL